MTDKYGAEYWKGRKFEDKYYHQALIFLDYCEAKRVFDYGCGMGYFVHAFRYFGADAHGYDISKYAIEHAFGLSKGFTYLNLIKLEKHDLVLCYDVLEHIPIEELDKIMDGIVNITGKWLILSICMAGDKNFELDDTHVTKRTKAWWTNQFRERGLKVFSIPEHFMFKNQMLLFRRVDNG